MAQSAASYQVLNSILFFGGWVWGLGKMISPHKHDVLKHLKKHPKGSQNAPNGTIFFKIFLEEAPRAYPPSPQQRGHPSRTLHLDGFAVLAKRLSAAWQCLLNCFLLLLAHLSRRLIGELIGYSWYGVRPSSVPRRSQCSKIFSETTGPIKAKFYVMPP